MAIRVPLYIFWYLSLLFCNLYFFVFSLLFCSSAIFDFITSFLQFCIFLLYHFFYAILLFFRFITSFLLFCNFFTWSLLFFNSASLSFYHFFSAFLQFFKGETTFSTFLLIEYWKKAAKLPFCYFFTLFFHAIKIFFILFFLERLKTLLNCFSAIFPNNHFFSAFLRVRPPRVEYVE